MISEKSYNYFNYNSTYVDLFGFEKFPVNVVFSIFDFLKLKPLTVLSMVSRQWKVVTEKAPLWINLCREAGILPEEAHSKPIFYSAMEQDNLEALFALSKFFSGADETSFRSPM